jgi:hypothetical protein
VVLRLSWLGDGICALRRRSQPALSHTFAKQPASRDADCRSVHVLLTRLVRVLISEVALYQQPDGKGQPLRAIASWGPGPLDEQIARSHEGGIGGHALGAKRVALGPLSRGCYPLGRGAPHDGVGVPARGFATIDLDADCWRGRCTQPGSRVGAFTAQGPCPCDNSVRCWPARQ